MCWDGAPVAKLWTGGDGRGHGMLWPEGGWFFWLFSLFYVLLFSCFFLRGPGAGNRKTGQDFCYTRTDPNRRFKVFSWCMPNWGCGGHHVGEDQMSASQWFQLLICVANLTQATNNPRGSLQPSNPTTPSPSQRGSKQPNPTNKPTKA